MRNLKWWIANVIGIVWWGKDKRGNSHFKQPSKMDYFHEYNLSARWSIWKQTMNLYLKVAMGKKYRNEQCRAVFYVIGLEG